MIERPLKVGAAAGRVGEWCNILLPRLSDAFYYGLDRRYEDTPAARRR